MNYCPFANELFGMNREQVKQYLSRRSRASYGATPIQYESVGTVVLMVGLIPTRRPRWPSVQSRSTEV